MPFDPFDDLTASFRARPPRRKLRLPPGWRDPDEDAYGDLEEFVTPEPSVLDEFRGGLFDPDIDEIEFQRRLQDAADRSPEPTWTERLVPRIAPAVVGAQTGASIGSVFGPLGTLAGGVLGGFAGGAGGEWLAEDVERMRGERERVNLRQIAMQGALNALPTGPVLSVPREFAKGAAFGLAGAELSALAEDRHATPEEFGIGAGATGIGSAALAALLRRSRGGRPALEGELLPPEQRRRPARRLLAEPDLEAEFWSDEGPSGPRRPGGPGGRGLPDPSVRDADILPDEEVGIFPYRPEPGLLPEPRPQIGRGRRYGTGPDDLGDPTLEELEAFMRGQEPPRTGFYQGRAGVVPNDPAARLDDLTDLADTLEEPFRPRQEPNIDIGQEPTGGIDIAEPEGAEGVSATRGRGRRTPVDLAGLDPRVRRELGRMVREMEESGYEPGFFVPEDPLAGAGDPTQNRPNAKGNYIAPSTQADIVHALQQYGGTSASRQQLATRLRRAIEQGEADPDLWAAATALAGQRVAGSQFASKPESGRLTNPYTGKPISLRAQLPETEGDWALTEEQRQAGALEQVLGDEELSYQDVEAASDRLDPDLVRRWSEGFVTDAEMRAAIEEANAAEVGAFFDEQSDQSLVDQLAREQGVTGEAQLLDEISDINASGESAASGEALSRQEGMRARGEAFVVYDRAGNRRPLIGPEAVDYQVRPGEIYGVEGPAGFRVLDDAGGRLPRGAIVRDMKEALRGPRDRDQLDVETESLSELEELENAIYGENAPTANTPAERPMGRRLEDMLPEGYLDDPATQDWLARLARGEVEERRAPGSEHVTLYRGQSRPGSGPGVPEWVRQDPRFQAVQRDVSGRWFTDDPSIAEWYAREAGNGEVVEVSVPRKVADQFQVRKQPDAARFSRDLDREYFLPRDIADTAQPQLDDILDTGERQPRLAGAEGVREQDLATPELADAPYALTPEAFEDPGVQPSLQEMVDVEGERWPETRHEVRSPEKVDEIAASMQRVGWKGRPALVLNVGDRSIAWTGTHRLEAAKRAGIPYSDVPKVEINAEDLVAAGLDPIELSKLGKKARIKALVDAGLTDAANLLEAERKGSPARAEAATSGVPEEVPDNVADFLYKQLKYSRAEIAAMGPGEAVRVGKERIVNPNAPAPRPAEAPEVGLERVLAEDPELAAAYERNISGIVQRQATRNLLQQRRRVPRRGVYQGGADAEANLPASQLGLPERKAPPAGVEAEDLITEGLRERPRRERPESELTTQEREARGLAPIAKEKLSPAEKSVAQSAARGKQTEMVHRAREMKRLIDNPSPQNLDEYVRLLGEQHRSQTKRELTGGTTTKGPERYRNTGEYLAGGLGGLEQLWRENPTAFWTIMRSSGGALIGALIDDEDPLRGAAMGAVLAGVAPHAFNRLRTIVRTGKVKPPRASETDISWYRLFAAPSPERTIPDVFAAAQESFRELERLYADPTRSQSSNIAAKQLYLSDLARELRELSTEAKTKGFKRKSWYLNKLADSVAGVPTRGQRFVTEVGSRVLEATGFSARKAPTPLHASVTQSFAGGRASLQEAADVLAAAKRAHADAVRRLQPSSGERATARQAVVDARESLRRTFKEVGESLRAAAATIDAEVGRTTQPGLVNQARRAREVGRKLSNYKSVKQAFAAIDRLETELGQGELRVKPDVVERTVSWVVYRTLIGYALDTAIQNLTQPILTTLFVRPTSLRRGYRYARTPQGRALSREIELRSLVDEETNAPDDRPLRVIADADGVLKVAKTVVKDSSRPLRGTDNYNRRVSYLAALEEKGALRDALRTGRVPEAADEFARSVVRKTQGHTGPLGNNPFHRGPIGGSMKPFTKYPGLFMENVIDALNDPQARGRAAVVALLGAMMLARGTGLDFEDLLVSGGRPFGIDLTQPGSLRPDRVARATWAGRAVSDVVGHISAVAGGERMGHEVVGHDFDSFLYGDLAYLLFGRYPTKLAQRGVEIAREGMGQHTGIRPSGEVDPHQAIEDVGELVGMRSTRITKKRRTAREASEAVNRSRRAREDVGAKARRLATIAIQRGDDERLQEALAMMSPAQRRAFLRTLGRTRLERLEQQLPRAERQQFRDEFGGGDELEEFIEGR